MTKYLILLSILIAFFIAACGQEPTPIIVYVTATPDNVLPPPPTSQDITRLAAAPRRTPTVTPAVTQPPPATNTPPPTPTTPFTPTQRPSDTPAPSNTPFFPDVPPAEELPVLDVNKFGIQVHPFVTRDEWTYILGHVDQINAFGWIKIQLNWSQLEPRQGHYDDLFYAYAQRVQWANFQGQRPYKVLLSVAKAPSWARPAGADLSLAGPPHDPQFLAKFITDFIRETKPEDNRIAAIEVWNEPNLEREWNGVDMSGQTYMEYFGVVYDAIKSIAPNIQVVTAGLAPTCGIPGTICDRDFFQQMYAGGLANYQDVKVGIHPYGWANPPEERCCSDARGWADNPVFFFLDTLEDYMDIMNRNNHGVPLWITEFGWGTYQNILVNGGDAPTPPVAPQFGLVTPEQQAEYTIRAMDMLQQPPLSDRVEVAILWNLNFATIDDAVANGQEQAGYSLLNAGGQPRLVYRYLEVARKIIPEF